MVKTLLGMGIGSISCVLLLALWGAADGFLSGSGVRHQNPAGFEGACAQALMVVVFYWPAAMLSGGFVGGIIGFVASRNRRRSL